MSVRDVARHFQRHASKISRLLNRFQHTGNVADRSRSGRPRKTTPREDRFPTTSSRRNRFLSSRKLSRLLRNSTGTIVCDRTVRNRLHAARLKTCRPYVGIPLTLRHHETRRQWAKVHQGWTRRQWRNVLFSDVSSFNVSFADGRVRTWRRRGERLDQDNVVQRDSFGGGSVMVWAGIHHDGKTDLVIVPGNLTAQRYCDGIIEPVVVSYLQQHNVGFFQHDNARPLTARHTQNIFRIHNVNVLQWPARSPDLSPTEHLQDHLGSQVKERHDVNNVRDLERALQAEWVRIPLQVIRKLVCSLAVLAANDGHTRF